MNQGLPALTDTQAAHFEVVLSELQKRFAVKPSWTLAEWMAFCLTEPGLGYYAADTIPFGPEGDFITAPMLTPLFGQSIAHHFLSDLQALKATHPDEPRIWLEVGPGGGDLTLAAMQWLESHHPGLVSQVWLLETSPVLRNIQHTKLSALKTPVKHIAQFPSQNYCGVLIANEILDALPAKAFLINEKQVYERVIQQKVQAKDGALSTEAFEWHNQPASESFKKEIHKLYASMEQPVPEVAQGEIIACLDAWVKEAVSTLKVGSALFLDYGFPRHELYLPERSGTLMCHSHHYAHSNPLVRMGVQDITTHVDFTQVAETLQAAHMTVCGYATQATFLMENGLLNFAENQTIEHGPSHFQQAQALQTLLMPHEMGELFKVIKATRNLPITWSGKDESHRLTTMYQAQ